MFGTVPDYLLLVYCTWDKWYIMVRLAHALTDPEKSRELRKCFDQHADDLDRLHCMLKSIGAEDVWDRYAELWMLVKERRNEFDECIKKGIGPVSRMMCIENIIADNIELEAVNGDVKFVIRHRRGK
ncbi:MAG: hypothetical protein LM583_10810 [Desulfurococcaceae archaeon]|nr:hypothetical protein [Desulfurococcaceae archaeon]